jgi:hypothetical protein
MIANKFKCPCCGGEYYERTKAFRTNKTAHGGMLRLVEPYRSYEWDTYHGGSNSSQAVGYSAMLCIGCGGELCPTGRLRRPKTCKVCGDVFNNNGKYLSHMKQHKKGIGQHGHTDGKVVAGEAATPRA